MMKSMILLMFLITFSDEKYIKASPRRVAKDFSFAVGTHNVWM